MDDDRRINERIASACGWLREMCGPGWIPPDAECPEMHTDAPPDYLADPARLPEMLAYCAGRYSLTIEISRRPHAQVFMHDAKGWEVGRTPSDLFLPFQRAVAFALATALEREG